jgi:outer membrane protein TolC
MKRIGVLAATAVLALSGAARLHAQEISDSRIRELIKQAAAQAGKATLDVQTPPAAQPRVPVVPITLEEAVKFALERNLDIAVQRLNPEINDIAIAAVRTTYHPALTSTISQINTNGLPQNQLQLSSGGGGTNSQATAYNAGVAQNVPWGGGALQVTLNNGRSLSNSNNALFNPNFTSNWSGLYTQPLLRNFRIDSTRQQLLVSRINRDISDVQLRSTITNTLSNVRNAYWDYVFATQAVEVAQQSVQLAEQLVKDNQTRVEVGTMAPIDVVQAQSQSATARQNLATVQQTRNTAELSLKRLIVNGTQDPNWSARLDPVDRPEFRAEPVDIEAAVRRALSERTDLEIAKKNIEANNVTLKYLVDQMKPQLDFQISYGLSGIGGTFLQRDLTQLGSPTTPVPLGISEAFRTLFDNKYPRWSAAVNLSYPLGVSAQETSTARARIQLNQVQAQTKQIELQIATDVTNAAVTATTAAERVEAAQAARELAQKQLEAEQSKFEVGMSTNYNVIQSQRDLATAQNNELQAVLNYRKALVELERLQQTTLQNLGVTVINAGGGGGAATTTNRAATGGGGQ